MPSPDYLWSCPHQTNNNRKYKGVTNLIFLIRGHSKSAFVEEGRREVIEKRTTTNRWRGMYVRSLFLKKMLRFSKWSFIFILQFFPLIIMAVWNIKQTIMKNYNIQSCKWMACDRFRQSFLLFTTFRSFLYTVHWFVFHCLQIFYVFCFTR